MVLSFLVCNMVVIVLSEFFFSITQKAGAGLAPQLFEAHWRRKQVFSIVIRFLFLRKLCLFFSTKKGTKSLFPQHKKRERGLPRKKTSLALANEVLNKHYFLLFFSLFDTMLTIDCSCVSLQCVYFFSYALSLYTLP